MMKGIREALDKAGLGLVTMLHVTADVSSLANFRYKTSSKVSDHIASLRYLVSEAVKVKPLFINVHGGCDSWNVQEAREFLIEALEIERETGIPFVHEGHRRRNFWNPYIFRDVLSGCEELRDLKVTLDISHWVLCLERCFATKPSF